jgi:hypothetical protein
VDGAGKNGANSESLTSTIGEFFHAAAYSAVESPVNAVGKLTEEVTGVRLLPHLNVIGAPEHAQFGSAHWHAQQIGGAVGSIVPFLATRSVLKSAGLARSVEPGFQLASTLNLGGKSMLIAENAIAGAAFSGLFQDAQGTGLDYWKSKATNMSVGAISFGALSGFSTALKGNGLLQHFIAGSAAGSIAADSRSLLEGRGLATASERFESAYSFGFTGVALKSVDNYMTKSRTQSVQEALGKISDPQVKELHDLATYSKAFEGFGGRVKKQVGAGADSISLEMTNGNILKITTRSLPKEIGSRGFDHSVLEQGTRTADGIAVNYFVQPKARPAKPGDLDALNQTVREKGYIFKDPALDQIGRHNGSPVLLDPFAVVKDKP